MNPSRSIDLHNCTVPEAIREFIRFYNDCVRSGYRGRIEVIHGYGSTGAGGTIRQELRKYLATHVETFGEVLAGESLRNPGVTILYPRDTPAPPPQGVGSTRLHDPAQQAIRRFCEKPQTKERILFKLRGRFGDQALSAAIRQMMQNGTLQAIRSSDGPAQYRAIAAQ